MKISPKQLAIAILCVIIAFIPTYTAITYYFVQKSDINVNYEVVITDHQGNQVELKDGEIKDVAEAVLKMNGKLHAAGTVSDDALGEKYYNITVSANNSVLSTYKYYFSTKQDEKTIVKDGEGRYYYLDYVDAKNFLSLPCAHIFYDNASLPILSIFGGNDVLPFDGEWRYVTISGSTSTVNPTTSSEVLTHAMNGATKLSFSVAPDKCTVRITTLDGLVIGNYTSLDDVPYYKLDSDRLCFEISAEWNASKNYSGYAKYKFYSSIGLAPEFSINKSDILSGEFVIVSAKNVSAPQKIEFSSTPAINYDPFFFTTEDGTAYALIPINKELSAPQSYVFNLAYGGAVSQFTVNVTQMSIEERPYDCSNITIRRTPEEIKEYQALLNDIGLKCENERYTSGGLRFENYDLIYNSDDAYTIHRFGWLRKPNNGDDPFRLDGVDYFMAKTSSVKAVAVGKIVYVGEATLLGKFVVIDHGMGLKTWYCNLGSISLEVGDIVAKEEAIGKPGSTGFRNNNGVFLITTLKNIPVSPYPLHGDGLSFN